MPLPFSLLVPAFVAGMLTFFVPCTFPLVPAYLGVISGVSTQGVRKGVSAWRTRLNVLLNAVLFVVGFSFLFILFGTALGWGGQFLFVWRRWIEYIAGTFIIVFGLSLMGLFRLPIFRATTSLHLTQRTPSRQINSLLLGMAFGTAWTPCVGPILGSILLVATASGNPLVGGILLAVFSLGLAVPFLLTALVFDVIAPVIAKISRLGRALDIASGTILVGLGVLIVVGKFSYLAGFAFSFLSFFHYERVLDFL